MFFNKYGSIKPLYEDERLEWSSFGTFSNEIECSIVEFKKGRVPSDRDVIYFKAAGEFLNSVLEAEKDVIKDGKIFFAEREHLTNSAMFVHAWVYSDLPFPKNDEEYHKEMGGFIGAFEKMAQRKQPDVEIVDKMEKMFSWFGELALRKIHKSSLTGCHRGQH